MSFLNLCFFCVILQFSLSGHVGYCVILRCHFLLLHNHVSQFDLLAQTGQAPIPEKMYLTLTGSTGGAKNAHEIDNVEVCANVIEAAETIDHYELDRDFSQGLTCEALNIESRACLDVPSRPVSLPSQIWGCKAPGVHTDGKIQTTAAP